MLILGFGKTAGNLIRFKAFINLSREKVNKPVMIAAEKAKEILP